MTRTLPLLVVLAAASIGCAQITYDSRELRRTVLRTDRTLTPTGIRATFHQSGRLIAGEAERTCDAVEVKVVQRRMISEPKNRALPADLVGLGFGASIAGLGTGMLVDANHVHDNDRNGRLYNSTGPRGARVGGALLVVTGALIMTAPVIDLVRTAAAKSKETVDVIKEKGPRRESGVPCDRTLVAAYQRVTARAGSSVVDLGATDKDGRFSVDLGEKLPAERLQAIGDPTRMQLWVGSSQAGNIVLAPPSVAGDLPPGRDPTPRTPVQVAISPEDEAKAKGAVKSAKEACVRACAASCSGKAACADACAAEACK